MGRRRGPVRRVKDFFAFVVLACVLYASAETCGKSTTYRPAANHAPPAPAQGTQAQITKPCDAITFADETKTVTKVLRQVQAGERFKVIASNADTVALRVDARAAWVQKDCVR